MIVRNGLVFGADFKFKNCDLEFENGIITGIGSVEKFTEPTTIDACGAYIVPGFVDIHTHGCMNHDFSDADSDGIEKMLSHYGKNGTTSITATTMSLDPETLADIVQTVASYCGKKGYGAVLRGINMEGPFLNKVQCGAQKPENIIAPDIALFERLHDLSDGNIRLLDIAPETSGALELIRRICKYCKISIAHTKADYETAAAAFKAGASHVTHMFNAMPTFGHREPGVIGAAFDYADFAEIICDGVHIHPSVIRAVFQMFGKDRVCLVSDSIRAAGMPNGEYELGGQTIVLKDGRSNLAVGGAIAGSASNLYDCFRNAVKFGIPLEIAVQAASLNPARAISADSSIGSLEIGKAADFLILNRDLEILHVYIGGERVGGC